MKTKLVRNGKDPVRVTGDGSGTIEIRIGEPRQGESRLAYLSDAQALKVARHLLTAVDEILRQR